jgi:hypothetical protein
LIIQLISGIFSAQAKILKCFLTFPAACPLVHVLPVTFSVAVFPCVAGPVVEHAAALAVAAAAVSEHEFFLVAHASVAGVAAPQASVGIFPAFDFSVVVSRVAAEDDSPGHPRFLAFPNGDYYASSSSSASVVCQESAHNSTGVRASHDLCSMFSSPGPHQNKNSVPGYNKPTHGYNNASDTNALPIGATTNRSRKTDLRLYREQHIHRLYQAALPHPEVPQIRWLAAEQFQYLHLPLPLPEQERPLPALTGLFPKVIFSFRCLLLKNITNDQMKHFLLTPVARFLSRPLPMKSNFWFIA